MPRPIQTWLPEFAIDVRPSPEPTQLAHPWLKDSDWRVRKADVIDAPTSNEPIDRFAEGFAAGAAAAAREAEEQAHLRAQSTQHAVAEARQVWIAEEADRLAQQITSQLQDHTSRLESEIANLLRVALLRGMTEQAIATTAAEASRVAEAFKDRPVCIRGRTEIAGLVAQRLEARGSTVHFESVPDMDCYIGVGETHIVIDLESAHSLLTGGTHE